MGKMIKFIKMHAAGNDYIVINSLTGHINNPSELAKKLSTRRFQIGADGLILICPSKTADVRMRMFNRDGSESQMCGNGIRCVARFTADHILSDSPDKIKIESHEKTYEVTINTKNKAKSIEATINMGRPLLEGHKIPTSISREKIINRRTAFNGNEFEITCVNMGNPHTVIFTENVDSVDLEKYGSSIENDQRFPERTNVEFVQVISKKEVRQRTWERGTGETLSCGSGAAAVCAAGVLTGKTTSPLTIHLTGGDLNASWNMGEELYLTGPTEEVFQGEIAIP